MIPQSDDFMLRFLRAAKFDYEAAHTLIKAYYALQVSAPELFATELEIVKAVFDDGVLTVLPNRTATDDAVIVFVPGRWSTEKYTFNDIMAAFVLTVEQLLREERNQVWLHFKLTFSIFRYHSLIHSNNICSHALIIT